MKQIIVKELQMTPFCSEDLLILTESQKQTVRDAVLQKEFIQFSTGELQIFKKDIFTFIVNGTRTMNAEFYAILMDYFYHTEAFSEKEKANFLPPFSTEIEQRQLYIAADELLVFKGSEFIQILREILKDTSVSTMSDAEIITSVRYAFLEQIGKL